MKFLIVLACVALASADVAHLNADATAPIVRSDYDIQPDGAFQYAYETGNGISAQSSGVVKNPNSEQASLEVKGAYSYTSPDGTPVQLTYVADENGYQPQGAHLPVGPAVPEAIARSLAYIAAHPAQATVQAAKVVASPFAALG